MGNLENYQSISIRNIFLATLVETFDVTPDEAEKYANENNNIQDVANKVKKRISEIKDFFNSTPYPMPAMSKLADQLITMQLEKRVCTAVVKIDNYYIDVGYEGLAGKKIPEELIENLEPISNYYKKEQLCLIKQNGKIVLDVDTLEPFEEYKRKYAEC